MWLGARVRCLSLPLQGVVPQGKQGAAPLTWVAQPWMGSMPGSAQGQDLSLGQVHRLFYAVSPGTDGCVGCKPPIRQNPKLVLQ